MDAGVGLYYSNDIHGVPAVMMQTVRTTAGLLLASLCGGRSGLLQSICTSCTHTPLHAILSGTQACMRDLLGTFRLLQPHTPLHAILSGTQACMRDLLGTFRFCRLACGAVGFLGV